MIVASFSSDATLRICERRWFLGSVVAHPTAKKDPLRREAHLLRQLMHPQAWAGQIVHTTVEKLVLPAVQRGELPEAQELIAYGRNLIAIQAEFSKRKLHRVNSKANAGKEFCALFADEYNGGLTIAEREEVDDRVVLALGNLARLETLWSQVRASSNISIERPFRVPLDGAILEAKPDLVILSGSLVTVVDWKCWTSLTADPSDQLRFYAHILTRFWDSRTLRADDFNLLGVNLLTASIIPVTILDADLDHADDRATEFLEHANGILDGRDWYEIDLRALSGPRNPNTCERCKFRGMCRDGSHTLKEQTSWLFPC